MSTLAGKDNIRFSDGLTLFVAEAQFSDYITIQIIDARNEETVLIDPQNKVTIVTSPLDKTLFVRQAKKYYSNACLVNIGGYRAEIHTD